MADARVLDTNVLILASAADAGSPFQPDATPVEEAEYRKKVLNWLMAFEQDAQRHAVLDWDWHICGEYSNKLTDQDYGWLAMMAKKDRNEVVWVGLEVDADGHASLPPDLAGAVTDLADRKMVAAVLAAQEDGHSCALANACDTDWLDCEAALEDAGIATEHLLEHEWLRPKWQRMKGRV
ncbi:hypothetical protein C662_01250 [Thauera sp. 28]|uniref:hypothetical protein n=1 Tax=Thauera sp. 28 TaxID=303682 RepID=UPI0002CFCCF6|nr:hypothetical protein [Thauera sp. 28]ENO94813.1 hypothetical protein C662_01250 [Thauera sp. 28]